METDENIAGVFDKNRAMNRMILFVRSAAMGVRAKHLLIGPVLENERVIFAAGD